MNAAKSDVHADLSGGPKAMLWVHADDVPVGEAVGQLISCEEAVPACIEHVQVRRAFDEHIDDRSPAPSTLPRRCGKADASKGFDG